MKRHHLLTVATAVLTLLAAGAQAQVVQQGMAGPMADDGHPANIASGKSNLGAVYTDSKGMTLYSMNLRYAAFRGGGGQGGLAAALKYCTGPCTQTWTAVAAPADAKPIGQWKVVEGAQGPQWAYKGEPVFTRVDDKAPGAAFDDGEDFFKAVAYIPPIPKIDAPANVAPLFASEAYILADNRGHALYTSGTSGACSTACDGWAPLAAGLASQSIGDWTVSRDGDRPQWTYRGKPVYVSEEDVPTRVPANGVVLRPGQAPGSAQVAGE